MKRQAEDSHCLPGDLGFEVSGLGEKPSYSDSDQSPTFMDKVAVNAYAKIVKTLFPEAREQKEPMVEIEVQHDGKYDNVSDGTAPTISILTKGGHHAGQKKRRTGWWFGRSSSSVQIAPMFEPTSNRRMPLRSRHSSPSSHSELFSMPVVSTAVPVEAFETTLAGEEMVPEAKIEATEVCVQVTHQVSETHP